MVVVCSDQRVNIVVESFFDLLENERIRRWFYETCELVRTNIFDYIEAFYNRVRRHSPLGEYL